MRQLKKRMLALGLLTVVCFAATALLRFWHPERVQEKQEIYMLTSYQDYRQVVVARIVQKGQELTLGNVNGETLLVGGEEKIPANQPEILKFFQSIYALPLEERLVEAFSGDLAEYGLDEPSTVVTLADINDGGVSFSLGNQTPDQKHYYCSVEGSGDIYLMDAERAGLFLKPLERFYDLSLYPSLAGEALLELDQVELLTNGELCWQLCREESKETEGGAFALTEPASLRVSQEHLEQTLLLELQELQGSSLVETEATDLSLYGLDNPRWELGLQIAGVDYRVLFGHDSQDGVYAMTSGQGMVISVKRERLGFLEYGYPEICGSRIMDYNIHQVAALSLESAQASFRCEIAVEEGEVHARLGDRELPEEGFLALFERLNLLSMGGACGEEAGELLFTLRYELAGGGTQVYEFYDLGDRQCAVAVNGKVLFWCYASQLEELGAQALELLSQVQGVSEAEQE